MTSPICVIGILNLCLTLSIGNLHFANVREEDEQSGHVYACVVYNPLLADAVKGGYTRISVRGKEFCTLSQRVTQCHTVTLCQCVNIMIA